MQRVLSSRPAVSPSAAKGPQAAPSLSPSRTSPTRLAHSWSASAWSSGAPSAVHTAPPPPAAAHTPPPPLLSTPTGRGDPPPQPRGSTPQPFSAHRRVVCHAPPPVDPMPPPRETTREKRLQQQRDALSYALSLAQAATGEEALRAELLRSELAQADATLQHVTTMIRSGRAESGMLKQQLDAMAAELGATRAELHRHQSHRPAASGSCSRMTARAAAPRAASVARRGARDAAVKPLASRAAHAASTQTDASVKDDRELEALSRTQAAELSGLRVQVEALQEQTAAAAARRRQEIDGREQAHAAAITAHGTSALHARLLWGETHALESHVAELSAELTKERQQHSRIQAAREVEVSELRATLAALRAEHEKELSRARASQRVLARNSRNFLEGKNELEKERSHLEQQVVELEEKKAALLKEQKEKGRLLRSKEEISQEQATRIADLERSLAQTRGVLKQHKETARQAAEQARADREVLAGCVQQMTDQLAAANAAKDSTHSNLVSFQEEMSERLHETERQLRESRHACETLQAQLIECERQLQLEVDGSHGQREEWEDALRSATARIDELESMLQETHGQAQTRLEALDDSHLRAKEAAALADEMEQEIERERVRIRLLQLEAGALEMQAVSVARAHQESRERERAMKDRLEALQQSSLQEASEAEQRLAARDSALETLRAEADIRTELLSSMMLHSRASFERDAATIRVLCASLAESEAQLQQNCSWMVEASSHIFKEHAEFATIKEKLEADKGELKKLHDKSISEKATMSVELSIILGELHRTDRQRQVLHNALVAANSMYFPLPGSNDRPVMEHEPIQMGAFTDRGPRAADQSHFGRTPMTKSSGDDLQGPPSHYNVSGGHPGSSPQRPVSSPQRQTASRTSPDRSRSHADHSPTRANPRSSHEIRHQFFGLNNEVPTRSSPHHPYSAGPSVFRNDRANYQSEIAISPLRSPPRSKVLEMPHSPVHQPLRNPYLRCATMNVSHPDRHAAEQSNSQQYRHHPYSTGNAEDNDSSHFKLPQKHEFAQNEEEDLSHRLPHHSATMLHAQSSTIHHRSNASSPERPARLERHEDLLESMSESNRDAVYHESACVLTSGLSNDIIRPSMSFQDARNAPGFRASIVTPLPMDAHERSQHVVRAAYKQSAPSRTCASFQGCQTHATSGHGLSCSNSLSSCHGPPGATPFTQTPPSMTTAAGLPTVHRSSGYFSGLPTCVEREEQNRQLHARPPSTPYSFSCAFSSADDHHNIGQALEKTEYRHEGNSHSGTPAYGGPGLWDARRGFEGSQESANWLHSEDHGKRIRQLREKYGYLK